MQETMIIPDYKLFLFCIYAAGVLTGGVIGAIVLAVKESEERKKNE